MQTNKKQHKPYSHLYFLFILSFLVLTSCSGESKSASEVEKVSRLTTDKFDNKDGESLKMLVADYLFEYGNSQDKKYLDTVVFIHEVLLKKDLYQKSETPFFAGVICEKRFGREEAKVFFDKALEVSSAKLKSPAASILADYDVKTKEELAEIVSQYPDTNVNSYDKTFAVWKHKQELYHQSSAFMVDNEKASLSKLQKLMEDPKTMLGNFGLTYSSTINSREDFLQLFEN